MKGRSPRAICFPLPFLSECSVSLSCLPTFGICLLLSRNTNTGLHLTLCRGLQPLWIAAAYLEMLTSFLQYFLSSPGNSSHDDLWIASIAGGDAKYQHLWIPVEGAGVINNKKTRSVCFAWRSCTREVLFCIPWEWGKSVLALSWAVKSACHFP